MQAREENIDIKSFLRSVASGEIYYCPNPGNAGDSSIATATYHLFDQVGLQYHCVEWDENFNSEGKSIVYGGGGNLTTNYSHARSFIKRNHEDAKQFILLPHTVQGHADLLRQLGTNAYLFCRERRSFEWIRQHTSGPTVYLADDLAFSLNPEKVIGEELFGGAKACKTASGTLVRSIRNSLFTRCGIDCSITGPTMLLRKAAQAGSKVLASITQNQSVLYAFRTDQERTDGSLPPANIDVSRVFSYGTAPYAVAKRATVGMMSVFNCYDHIVTNRLHGAILAALLGKKVDFYANSYFKNEEVYKYSIEGRFPRVRWCGEWEGE